MAEMVGSIVVGEVVNRTSSFIIGKHRERLSTREVIERLEMAHIKMEAALELSGRWQQQQACTTDASLLRWRRKLRRAADECDAAVHRWKLRELEEEDARERLARAPLPRRVAHAVLCFLWELLLLARLGGGGRDDEWSRASAAVQRFERLASGAAEFLRCVELGSAPRRYGPGGGLFGFGFGSGPVVGRLGEHAAGYERLQGAPQQQHRFLDAGPASPAEAWVDTKPCRAYAKRRPPSGKKLQLLV